MFPKISVILVNYNSWEDTIECVNSLIMNEYMNKEIIVVDNGSSNVDQYANNPIFSQVEVKLIKSETNLGFSGGNNVGIVYAIQALTDFVVLLNNDTLVKTDFLTRLYASYIENGKPSIVCGKILYYSNPDTIWYAGGEINFSTGGIEHWGCNKKDQLYPTQKLDVSFATGCLWFMPKETLSEVGYLDESYFLYSEDADYCCRINNLGLRILYDPNIVIYHKVGASSKMSKLSQYYSVRNDFYVFDKYAPSYNKKLIMFALAKRKIKEIIVGNLNFKYAIKGYCDYRKKINGKSAL